MPQCSAGRFASAPGERPVLFHHLLQQVPYGEVPHPEVILPKRERHEGYRRSPTPAALMVPEIY
jgi:hypothetical protein